MDVDSLVLRLGPWVHATALWRWMEPGGPWIYLRRVDQEDLVWTDGFLLEYIQEEFGGGSYRARVVLRPPMRFGGRPSIGPFFLNIAGPSKR